MRDQLLNEGSNNQNIEKNLIDFIYLVKTKTGKGSLNSYCKLAASMFLAENPKLKQAYREKYDLNYIKEHGVEGHPDAEQVDEAVHNNLHRAGLI